MHGKVPWEREVAKAPWSAQQARQAQQEREELAQSPGGPGELGEESSVTSGWRSEFGAGLEPQPEVGRDSTKQVTVAELVEEYSSEERSRQTWGCTEAWQVVIVRSSGKAHIQENAFQHFDTVQLGIDHSDTVQPDTVRLDTARSDTVRSGSVDPGSVADNRSTAGCRACS